jgi:folate-dependent phosphoribosylglycinamide formyltransferase PurN
MSDKYLKIKTSVEQAVLDYVPRITCICGSTRFIEEMAMIAWEFEKRGVIALGPHLLPKWPGIGAHHQAEREGVQEILDTVHLRKIAMADLLYVANVDGYIGDRTKEELTTAKKMGKKTMFFY